MAKSVHEKKKRIARIKSLDNHEYHDIVSSIMNGMDNNLPSTYSNKLESDLFESREIFSKKKAQHIEIPNTKQHCVNVPKSKKFGLSRKFPLMEKTQRTLKQIRHNRKVPKPRAHLAGLSDLPPIDKLVSVEKSKNIKVKNIGKTQNKKVTDKTVHRKVTASGNERKRKSIEDGKDKIAFKKNKSGVTNKNGAIKESCNLVNNNSKESDSSSDAEFERFIQDEKKDLPKNSKKLSRSTSKKISKSASKKDISRSVRREKYSDMSDEESELPKLHYKSNKRLKNKHEIVRNRQSRVSVEKSNESEMSIVYNETCHDSSSESDGGVSHMSSNNDSCSSKLSEQIGNEFNSVPELNSPLHKTSSLVSNNQSSIVHKTHIASLESSDQPNIPHAVSLMDNSQSVLYKALHNTSPITPHSVLVNQHNIIDKVCDVSSVSDNSQPSTIVKSESFGICDVIKNNPISINCSASKNSDQSLLIDLTESDNECETTSTITPKIVAVSGPNQNELTITPKIVAVSGPNENALPSHSEESEVEVVDVIVHDLPQKSKKKIKQQPSKENILIKTEPVSQTVNSTNILNKKVKDEPCDECEIIFDVASTSNGTKMTDIQKCTNSNIKIEKDLEKSAFSVHVPNNRSFAPEKKNKLAQKEEKLHEVACSNLRNIHKCLEPSENERMHDLHHFDIKSLLEAFKKELSTYKEIVETEQSVEETFKLLEKHQAEKITSLRSRISQFLKSSGIGDNCSAIKNAVDSLRDTESSSSKSLQDTVQDTSIKPEISVQDLKTFAAMNIVPLSSIPENDIKPDVSQLQHTLKQKESTSYETNNMSFGEKCIVCAKDASAACQQCAKVFFCSNECGVKYWENGHKNTCVK